MKRHSSLSRRQLCFTGFLFLVFCCLTLSLFSIRQDEKRFTNITSRLFVSEMEASTLNMHYTIADPSAYGIYDYKPLLPGYDSSSSHKGQSATKATLAQLSDIHTDKLTPQDAWLHTLLTRYLENSLTLSSYSGYYEPLSPHSGMQSQLPILLAEYTFRSKRDVEDYLALLEQTDEYFASLLVYEQEKADAGLLMPASFLRKVREQCDSILTEEALEQGTHFLQLTFRERLAGLYEQKQITDKEAAAYIARNDRLLRTVLLPAYTALGDGLLVLEDDSITLSGLASTPDGKAYYEALLVSETGSYRSVAELQTLLSDQFAAEYEAIRSILAAHPEAAQYYKQEAPAFPLTTPEQMLSDLQARMQKLFPPIPGTPAGSTVKTVSESLQDYTAPAFYLTAPLDDTAYNVIYINHKKTPDGLELYTTLAHEGYPGHLYQNVYHNRQALATGARPAGELLWYGGYLEGWALYTEFLSYDFAAGLLLEGGNSQAALYAEIEKHNRSLQLCLYSLLDIMIHYENASYSRIAKMLEGFGITDSSSIKAIYSYIAAEPCNYPKYYVGYLEILSLKEQALAAWGNDYSDYRFHCFILDNGPADFLSLSEKLQTIP